MEINEFKEKLKEIIQNDVNGCLKLLRDNISTNSEFKNEIVTVIGRFNDADKAHTMNTLNYHEWQLEISKIRAATLRVIDKVTQIDVINEVDDKERLIQLSIDSKNITEDLISEESEEYFEEDELGYFDYVNLSNEVNEEIISIISDWNDSINSLGVSMEHGTNKLVEVYKNPSSNTELKNSKIIDISSEIATSLSKFEGEIRPKLAQFKQIYPNWAEYYFEVIRLEFEDFGGNIKMVENSYHELKLLREKANFGRSSLHTFYLNINRLPRVTKRFNKSKKLASRILEKLLRELDLYLIIIDKFIDSVSGFISENKRL